MDETLTYLKDRYKDEQARFDHFENKCAKFLTAVSIVIVALTALVSAKGKVIFALHGPLDVLAFGSFIAAAFCVVCSWGHALNALRIRDCPSLPSSRETAEWMKNAAPNAYKQHLFNCYIDTLEKLKSAIDEKSKPLDFAYSEMVYAAWALSLLAVISIGRELYS
ncbi:MULTISPECIES: hypothetical protein [unclassified Pseudomonas]|uniref:hypothetical protein n=1 Tax=unclassified Pseudomonas TaxID=196821 RepID=UPI002AB38F87|nr:MULTISPECIES: hypothetical protein [unclassified Pseudomonas]MDY7560458.1 hypothetical protein [Pseudomonas sp. AB6]MEA9975946.1 hypothetical protein [Pseudomonas sp. RTS4]MEA9993215.1 hypothetical protein [Pseudomonas sp. AA4]MEB0043156.1 hypothetical protein [Pseudomonas sp. MH10]MEB0077711.1 hypothetical protein [Pseudomonas sp. MH10out]